MRFKGALSLSTPAAKERLSRRAMTVRPWSPMAPLTSTASPGLAAWPEGAGLTSTSPTPAVVMNILSHAPFGTTMFVACGLSEQPVSKVARQLIPFVLVEVFCAFLFAFIPALSTFLPNLLK